MTSKPDTGGYGPDEPPDEPPQQPPCTPCASDPEDCDSKAMAQIRCKANGIEAQADFNKEHQPQLDKAQEDYNAARGTYRETRAKLAPQVHEMRHHVAHLVDRIRCMIKQERGGGRLPRRGLRLRHRPALRMRQAAGPIGLRIRHRM